VFVIPSEVEESLTVKSSLRSQTMRDVSTSLDITRVGIDNLIAKANAVASTPTR